MVCNFTGLLKAPKSESNVAIRDCFALDHAFEMKFAFPAASARIATAAIATNRADAAPTI